MISTIMTLRRKYKINSNKNCLIYRLKRKNLQYKEAPVPRRTIITQATLKKIFSLSSILDMPCIEVFSISALQCFFISDILAESCFFIFMAL